MIPRWYLVAVVLLLPLASHSVFAYDTLMQYADTGDTATTYVDYTNIRAQGREFTANSTYTLTTISNLLGPHGSGTPACGMLVQIWTGDGNKPTSKLADFAHVLNTNLNQSAWNVAYNATGYALTSGTTYWLVWAANATCTTNYWQVRYKGGGSGLTEAANANSALTWQTTGFDTVYSGMWRLYGTTGGAAAPSQALALDYPTDAYHTANTSVIFDYNLNMTNFGGNTSTCNLIVDSNTVASTASISTNGSKSFTLDPIFDASGNGYTLTNNGGVVFNGSNARFNGSNYLTGTGNISSVYGSNSLSAGAWINHTMINTTYGGYIVAKDTNSVRDWFFDAEANDVKVRLYNSTGGSCEGTTSLDTVTPGTPRYVSFSFDITTKNLSVYVDAVLARTLICSNIDSLRITNNPILLGTGYTKASPTYVLNGTLEDVRLWNCFLNASEFEAEKASSTPVKTSCLVASWPFDTSGALNESSHSWAVNCTSTGANVTSQTSARTLVVDRTNPLWNAYASSDVPATNGSEWNIASSGVWLLNNRSLSDIYVYGWNVTVTHSNGTVLQTNQTTGLTCSVCNYTQTNNVSSWFTAGSNSSTLTFTHYGEDDHTAKIIPAYTWQKTTNGLDYITEHGNHISIWNNEGNLKSITTQKQTDRYTFAFEPNNNRATWSFSVTCDGTLTDRTELWGYPMYVCKGSKGGNWIDFNLVDDTMTYESRLVNAQTAEVTITRGKAGKEAIKFSSIGGLNNATEIVTLTLNRAPPQVPSATVTALGLSNLSISYTKPSNATGTTILNSSGAVLYNGTNTSVSYTHDGLIPATSYTYTIKSYYLSSAAETIYNESSLTAAGTTLTVPQVSDLNASNITASSVLLSYTKPTNATGTTLYNQTGDVLYNGTNTSVSYNVTGLSTATAYWFDVLSWYNASGVAVYNSTVNDSNNVSVTTLFNGTLTFNFIDELNKSLVVGPEITLDLIVFDTVSNTYTTNTGQISINNITSANYTFRYGAENYTTRFYFGELLEDSTSTVNLTMLLSSEADTIEVFVYDKVANELEGATVEVYKYYVSTNTYDLVEVVRTNFEGQTAFSGQLSQEYYKFLIYYDGTLRFTSEETYIYESSISFYIRTGQENLREYAARISITSNITKAGTNVYSFNYTDAQAAATGGCLLAYRLNATGRTLNGSNCTAGSAGMVMLTLPNVNGSYHLEGVVTKAGTNYTVAQTYAAIQDAIDDAGGLGLFSMFIMMVIIGFIALWRPDAAILTTSLVPLLFIKLGWVNLEVSTGVLVFTAGVLLAIIVDVVGK